MKADATNWSFHADIENLTVTSVILINNKYMPFINKFRIRPELVSQLRLEFPDSSEEIVYEALEQAHEQFGIGMTPAKDQYTKDIIRERVKELTSKKKLCQRK